MSRLSVTHRGWNKSVIMSYCCWDFNKSYAKTLLFRWAIKVSFFYARNYICLITYISEKTIFINQKIFWELIVAFCISSCSNTTARKILFSYTYRYDLLKCQRRYGWKFGVSKPCQLHAFLTILLCNYLSISIKGCFDWYKHLIIWHFCTKTNNMRVCRYTRTKAHNVAIHLSNVTYSSRKICWELSSTNESSITTKSPSRSCVFN